MEILNDRYTITELSKKLGVTDHALRYYEKEFCLNVPRDELGRRYYTPELANIMHQIKKMRDEGLGVKAIKKILEKHEIVAEEPPVAASSEVLQIIPVKNEEILHKDKNTEDIKMLLQSVADHINKNLSAEFNNTREQISKEIYKSKLELGACVENSVRRLESKMEKHFENIDRSITDWRERNKSGRLKRKMKNLFK